MEEAILEEYCQRLVDEYEDYENAPPNIIAKVKEKLIEDIIQIIEDIQ